MNLLADKAIEMTACGVRRAKAALSRSYAGVAGGKLLPVRFQHHRDIGDTPMEARTVNNLPPAGTDDGRRTLSYCNRIEQEELDCCRQYALVGQDQSPHVEGLRWEGAVGSVRADPDASCQRNEAARGDRLLL